MRRDSGLKGVQIPAGGLTGINIRKFLKSS
jgi:hypothetical protein